ncbi:hypothetical protein Q9L58_007991, partial [Maublancomyces gigas]
MGTGKGKGPAKKTQPRKAPRVEKPSSTPKSKITQTSGPSTGQKRMANGRLLPDPNSKRSKKRARAR